MGSSEVHDVAGHKARARMYPWGIVDSTLDKKHNQKINVANKLGDIFRLNVDVFHKIKSKLEIPFLIA